MWSSSEYIVAFANSGGGAIVPRPYSETGLTSQNTRVLAATFFDRPAEKVAHDLIGCRLHWKDGDQSHSRIVTETEAYTGPDDLASHASKGRTKRNEAMFGQPGTFYIYFVYGMHWMLNVVTGG